MDKRIKAIRRPFLAVVMTADKIITSCVSLEANEFTLFLDVSARIWKNMSEIFVGKPYLDFK